MNPLASSHAAAPMVEAARQPYELTFNIYRYRYRFTALERLSFHEQAGSALRGMLGHALMKLVCPSAGVNQANCTCADDDPCAYRKLFRPSPHQLPSGQILTPPAPLIIEASCIAKSYTKADQGFFDLVLIGDFAHQSLELLQLAFALAMRTQVRLGRAELTEVTQVDVPLSFAPACPSSVLVQLITPLKLQHHGRIVGPAEFSAEIFIRALERRYQIYESLYSHSRQATPSSSAEDLTANSAHSLSCVSWTRWSNRQSSQIPIEALVGWIEFSDLTDRAWHYLYYGQWLHAGKHSLFGLGQYRVWNCG